MNENEFKQDYLNRESKRVEVNQKLRKISNDFTDEEKAHWIDNFSKPRHYQIGDCSICERILNWGDVNEIEEKMTLQKVIDKHFPLEGTKGYKSTTDRFATFLENTYKYLGCCNSHPDKMKELIKDLKETK